MSTAQEKFVKDYLLVIDNDREAYKEVLEVVEKHDGEVFAISSELKEAFEEYISQAAEREREDGRQLGGDLIAQLLTGFGTYAFEDIARHYVRKAEGN
jgi:cell fate regulator YaaT (PSP1 superfamily)